MTWTWRPTRTALTVGLAVVMAAALTAPAALANHSNEVKKNGSQNVDNIDGPHEEIPNPPKPLSPKAECTFLGIVDQAAGKPPTEPVHDHVTLRDLTLACTDLEDPITGHFNTSFDVDATAGNDGESAPNRDPKKKPKKSDTHGATATQGWSHSNGYSCGSAWDGFPHNANKGDIKAVDPISGQSTIEDPLVACANPWFESWFKFTQGWINVAVNEPGPPSVYAWGQLAWDDDKKDLKEDADGVVKRLPNCFVAPDVVAFLDEDENGDPIVRIAGVAFITDAYDYVDLKTGEFAPTPQEDKKKINACDFQTKQAYPDSPSSSSSGDGSNGGGGTRGPKS